MKELEITEHERRLLMMLINKQIAQLNGLKRMETLYELKHKLRRK